MTCKNCGEKGHIAKTCKKNVQIIKGPIKVIDHTEYRKTATPYDVIEIQRLKGIGLKSHEVAEQIHLHLESVNKHWCDGLSDPDEKGTE